MNCKLNQDVLLAINSELLEDQSIDKYKSFILSSKESLNSYKSFCLSVSSVRIFDNLIEIFLPNVEDEGLIIGYNYIWRDMMGMLCKNAKKIIFDFEWMELKRLNLIFDSMNDNKSNFLVNKLYFELRKSM